MIFYFNLTKNYSLDVLLFYKIRNFSDGVSFFNFDINLDLYKADHNPQFTILFELFNYTIFEFTVYNKNHENNI